MYKRSILLLIGVATLASLAGCAGSRGGPLQPHPPVKVDAERFVTILHPSLGVAAGVEVGGVMLSKRYVRSSAVIQTSSPVSHVASHNGIDISLRLPPGHLVRYGENAEGVYYIADNFSASITVMGSVQPLKTQGGLIIKNDTSETKKVFRKPESIDHAFISEHSEPINVVSRPDREFPHKENYARELIYTGVSKNVISVIYREFSNDLIRPAFSQELKYDLGEGSVIGFRGARFEVIGASNTELKYKVIRNLD